jgi:hypothetical protein
MDGVSFDRAQGLKKRLVDPVLAIDVTVEQVKTTDSFEAMNE